MQRGEFTLNELTELAGVSVRTVRYYIAEGLLPPPDSAGRGTTYSQGHLDRLLLIGMLKENYLPLREIRKQLSGLTDLEVGQLLEEMRAGTPAELGAPMLEERDDASSYIRRMMEDSDDADRSSRSNSLHFRRIDGIASRAPVRSDAQPRSAGIDEVRDYPQRRYDEEEPGTQWRRIELGPDAELHIRQDAFERNRSRVEWLIDWATRVFR